MKKTAALLMVLVMMFVSVGCSSDDEVVVNKEGTVEEYQTLLQQASTLPVGTMGVSGYATSYAIELLDWCEATTMTADNIRTQTQRYYDSSSDKVLFAEQWQFIVSRAASLADDAKKDAYFTDIGENIDAHQWTSKAFSHVSVMEEQVTTWMQDIAE